jgi:hypothetical protein
VSIVSSLIRQTSAAAPAARSAAQEMPLDVVEDAVHKSLSVPKK